ncbi:unnamed protein product [Blepharisma stoltei]|uniref:Uncharacterized protein n=1 Tax=Blepharisma stoltei TaxID=1481888 RepID=A0AAU9JD19_9CILI|nr:unnamed protein product [Blepharisma stoltei]
MRSEKVKTLNAAQDEKILYLVQKGICQRLREIAHCKNSESVPIQIYREVPWKIKEYVYIVHSSSGIDETARKHSQAPETSIRNAQVTFAIANKSEELRRDGWK